MLLKMLPQGHCWGFKPSEIPDFSPSCPDQRVSDHKSAPDAVLAKTTAHDEHILICDCS